MLVTSGEMLKKASEGHYAIPAPDFWDSNSAKVFCKTAEEMKKPLILSFAEIHLSMMSVEEAAELAKFYGGKVNVPVALHLDHGMHLEVVEEAVRQGFTSIMIDASSDPFEENIRKTKEAVRIAHTAGVEVEAEIGHVGANPGGPHAANESVYTEVEEAKRFVAETKVDSLAVSIGTAHGLYAGTPRLNFTRLEELKAALSVPLVLHGGSSTGDENLSRCAMGGIAKINLFTDFIVAALDHTYASRSATWLDLLKAADGAVGEVLKHYYNVFGTEL